MKLPLPGLPLPTLPARVLLGSGYLYLVMSSYYILKPVRDSFFLEQQGYRNLPIVHLLVLFVTFFAAMLYAAAYRRLGPERFIAGANLCFLTCILFFWLVLTRLAHVEPLMQAMSWVYFCFVSVFSVTAVTVFWSQTHTRNTPSQAAKSYGLIGAGASLGAMTGGGLTHALATRVSSDHQLLLVALALLFPCLVIGRYLAKSPKEELPSARQSPTHATAWALFRSSPYLCALAGIVFLWVFIMVLEEYRHMELIQKAIPERDQRTAFLGSISFFSGPIGLFLSVVVTGPVLTRYGAKPALLTFAGLIVTSGLAIVVAPSLTLVQLSRIAYGSVGYSIGQWSREYLYTVRTTAEKFIAKGYIDTFIFRLGAGCGSIGLILGTRIGGGPDGVLTGAVRTLSFVTIPLGLFLAYLVWWICGQFRRAQARRT